MRLLVRLSLVPILFSATALVAAAGPGVPASKAPEITTIGPASPGAVAAGQAKLAEVLHRIELQRSVPAPATGLDRRPSALELAPKAPFLETRVPATGPRPRFKPVDLAPAVPVLPAPAKTIVKAKAPGERP